MKVISGGGPFRIHESGSEAALTTFKMRSGNLGGKYGQKNFCVALAAAVNLRHNFWRPLGNFRPAQPLLFSSHSHPFPIQCHSSYKDQPRWVRRPTSMERTAAGLGGSEQGNSVDSGSLLRLENGYSKGQRRRHDGRRRARCNRRS